jgi:Tfp pilus assembly protein PilO
MELGISPEWKRQIDDVVVQLRDPFKLRLTAIGLVCLIGFGAVYRPLSRDLALYRRDLAAAQQRENTIEQIEKLRTARTRILKVFPPKGDLNFWSEYFLEGTRTTGVQLRALESKVRPQKAGTLQGIYVDLEIDGSYEQLHHFIRWIESSHWFTRIITLKIKNKDGRLEARITAAVMAEQEQKSGR